MKKKLLVLHSVLGLLLVLSSIISVIPVRAASVIIVPSPAYSIQDAVNSAIPGDTVMVLAGTYDQTVKIDKAITFKGDGAVLKPITASLQGDSVIYITSDDVTIKNFVVDGTGSAVYYGIYGLNVERVTISNVVIHDMTNNAYDNAGVGILLFGWGQGIDNCVIDRATVYNTPRMGIFIGGMDTSGWPWLLSDSNTISKCNIYNTWIGPTGDGGGAIQINSPTNCLIKGNNVHHNTMGWFYCGVYIYNSGSGNELISNNIHHNYIGLASWPNTATPPEYEGLSNKIHHNEYDELIY